MTPAQRTREWRLKPGNKERALATKAAFRRDHPKEWRAQRKAAQDKYLDKNRQLVRDKATAKRIEQRAVVIEAYGSRCACPGCHVHHAELLTIDHVGGGARHRQNRRSTRDIYREIIKAGFPAEFQLLCGSCNLAKADRDKCPLAGEEH